MKSLCIIIHYMKTYNLRSVDRNPNRNAAKSGFISCLRCFALDNTGECDYNYRQLNMY